MTETVLLPPPLPAVETGATTRPARWPDSVLGVLVLVFAFLAASFTARNSDFWLHLATGRLLAHGDDTVGADPFAYTTAGVYWANQSWLFDLALYAGYQGMGGPGLVLLKAAAIALLAGLMLRLGRSDGPFWLNAACTLLAVLALSPRLLLQPACLSLVLLAVCLALLRAGGRAFNALPAVIALWVNLDAWFVLGPLLVLLYGIGLLLGLPGDKCGRLPRWLLPACLAACLLSPHHIHALTLPAELSLSVWSSDFRHDARLASLFDSPWQLKPLGLSGGVNLSAWAYFVLLALGLASFAMNRRARRGWRLPVWLAFALLGAWQARLVPFFAVLAGPITALNLGEGRSRLALAGFGRAMLLLVCLALMALSWPGWLQGFHRHDRAFAWSVHTDPSLHRVAQTLAGWRRDGTLPAKANLFSAHADVGHYLAWFCPGERYYLDSRLSLFVPVASDYRQLCRAVDGDDGSEQDWRQALRDRHIACVVLYDPVLGRLGPALRELARPSGEWELLRVDGQALLIGWKEAETGPLASAHFDAERLAFASGVQDILPPAPEEGPAELARPRPWWAGYLNRPSGSSWEADAAAVYVRMFEESAEQQTRQQRAAVLARHAAGMMGLLALPAGAVPSLVAEASRLVLVDVFLPNLTERSPALPLLAVRAARRAVAAHPDDAAAWLVLAQAYLALGRTTTEASGSAPLPLLAEVRYIQVVTALEQAVILRSDLAAAHEALARLYTERQFLDLALQHHAAQLRLNRAAGPSPQESDLNFARRIEPLEQTVTDLRTIVQDRENRFIVRTQALAGDPLARAHIALDLGLAGKALDDVLLRSHADLYGVEGLRLLLELLLRTGRAQDARDLLDRKEMQDNPNGLGLYDMPGGRDWGYRFPAFDWFDLCQTAAAGHYPGATQALTRLRDRLTREEAYNSAQLAPRLARRLLAELGLGAVIEAALPRQVLRLDREQLTRLLLQNQFQTVERADLRVLDGMLQLEVGHPADAEEQFRQARALYQQAANTAPALPGQPLARRYGERMRPYSPGQ